MLSHRLTALAAAALSALSIGLAAPVRAQPADFEVRLVRTACFGTCPSYLVIIHRDGLVEYEGRDSVKVTGRQTSHIGADAVRQLFDKFEAAHFFQLAASYRASITDQPTVALKVRKDGVVHSVEDYAGLMVGMPQAVEDLETAVDQTANIEQWIGTPEERRQIRR